MTDQRPNSATGEPRKRRGVPPLVWIVLVLLVAWFVIMMVQRKGADVTPQGGTAPVQKEGPSTMPATPPSGAAPGTPASVGNGPNQPAPEQR